ncbi:MAG: DUF6804 family protein [Desulfurivibrionaceae bacterium]
MTNALKSRIGSVVPQIVAVAMLMWAFNPSNPYGYYILLRVVICAICVFLALRADQQNNTSWVWILGVTAVVYNPVLRIHLTREIWSVVNFITIVILLLTFRALR